MTLIEGIGDEVLVGFSLLAIVLLCILLWVSTHPRDIPFFSVIIFELSQRSANWNNNNQQEQTSESNGENQSHDQHTDDVIGIVPSPDRPISSETITDQSAPNAAESVEPSEPQNEVTQISRNEGAESVCSADNEVLLGAVGGIRETLDCSTNVSSASPNVVDSYQADSMQTLRDRRLAFFTGQNKDTSNDYENYTDVKDKIETCHSGIYPQQSNNADSSVKQPDIISNLITSEAASISPATTHQQVTGHSDRSTADESQSDSMNFLNTPTENQIAVRLKYLNDTQRLVHALPTNTIGQFRRTHFPTEIAENKLVRFILNGQELRNDTYTLQAYNVTNNCVVHCLITQSTDTGENSEQENEDAGLELGYYLFPLFTVILVIIWYFRIIYRQYFNAMSTFSLIGITFMFLLAYISSWRSNQERQEQHLHEE